MNEATVYEALARHGYESFRDIEGDADYARVLLQIGVQRYTA